jgi:putative cell wall-binding protein
MKKIFTAACFFLTLTAAVLICPAAVSADSSADSGFMDAAVADSSSSDSSSAVSGGANGEAVVCVQADSTENMLGAAGDEGFSWEMLMDVSDTDADGLLKASPDSAKELMLVTSDTLSTEELIARLKTRSDVVFAEPNCIFFVSDLENGAGGVLSDTAESTAGLNRTISDYSSFQWGIFNNGTVDDGTAGYDIGNTDSLKGSDDVILAVMDTGIMSENRCLKSRMIDLNAYPGIMSGTGCGKYGINMVSASGEVSTDTYDYYGHGTHVAGIIGADGSDGGVRGVMSNVKLVSVRVLGKKGAGRLSDIVKGCSWLIKAKEQYGVGIRGVNCSIGSSNSTTAQTVAFQELENAGITPIVASGNDNKNVDVNPASSGRNRVSTSIVVDAMDAAGKKALFSNYGWATDVMAPGVDILSTVSDIAADFVPFTAMKDGTAVLYQGFEDQGTADPTDPSTAKQLIFHYYDEKSADGLGTAASTDSRFLLGRKSLRIDAAMQDENGKVTIVSEPLDISSELSGIDLSTVYESMAAITDTAAAKIVVDYRTEDGFTDGFFATGAGNNQWILNQGTRQYPLSMIAKNEHQVLDLHHFQIKITVSMNGNPDIWIDCAGVGTGLDDFTLMSGTSMASPVTAGIYGLMCASHPEESSAKLSARVIGGTVKESAYSSICSSGGRVDVHKADTDPDPVIRKCTVENGRAVLEGWFFGEEKGTVTIGGRNADVVSWQGDSGNTEGSVTAEIPSGMSSEQVIVLSRTDAAYGRTRQSIDSTATDYQELSIPDGTDFSYNSYMTTAVLDGKIYMLFQGENQQGQTGQAAYNLECYDPSADQWTFVKKLQPFPKDMVMSASLSGSLTSMTGYQGKLYFLKNLISLNLLNPYASTASAQLVSYDPAKDVWSEIGDPGYLPAGANLCAYQDKLFAVGGSLNLYAQHNILQLDPETGAGSAVGTFEDGTGGGWACTSGGKLVFGSSRIAVTDLNTTEYYDLPEYDEGQEFFYSLAGVGNEVLLTGLVYTGDGGYTDSWLLNLSTGKWNPAGVRVNASKCYSNTAVGIGDTAYVWAGVSKGAHQGFFRKHTFWNRLSGEDRYETAAKIATAAFPDGAETAILTTGLDFPDALAAAAYAGAENAPVLLAEKDELGSRTAALMKSLGVKKVIIIGGTSAVSMKTERSLFKTYGIAYENISRISGDDRAGTARAVYETGVKEGLFGSDACVVASGLSAADALSMSPWMYSRKMPIFLTDEKGNLSAEDLASAEKFGRVYLAGGTSVVSSAVEAAIGEKAVRLAGSSRYETSARIAGEFTDGSMASFAGTAIASGNDSSFADALAGASLQGKKPAPIILADGTAGAGIELMKKKGTDDFTILGGAGAVSYETASAADRG